MKKLFSALLMGVFILTSVSVFTSCKDNDDDIKAIREDVAALRAELTNVKAALETELQSSKSMFETQIAQVKKELQDAIDKKADEATVSALREKLTGLETDYKAKMAVVEAQLEAANQALSKLDDKADKATVDNVIATVAALTGQLADESKAREAIEANLQIQIEALKKLRQELSDANYQGQIDGLIQACQNFDTTVADVNVMKKTINNLELQLSNFNQYISALEVLVERMLNSISLVPQLFIGGIEAIEFIDLKYQEFNENMEIMKKNPWYILDKGETEATYRLNPATVQRDAFDENGIEFLAATAAVTPEYMFAPAKTRNIEYIPSPVLFNGIKSFKNGLMTVYLKKRDRDFNINWRTNRGQYKDGDNVTPLSEDSIYIVALKVPRNAGNGYEALDIVSENSRLVERWYSPRIAALPNPAVKWHGDWKGKELFFDGLNNLKQELDVERPIHYWDAASMWAKRVDARPLEGVAHIVDYDQTFDVSTIVTGCLYEYTTTIFGGECIRRIDVDELKKYGIEINYSIPTREYKTNAPNTTNQQEFAQIIDATKGTIQAKTPAGVTDNKAVIGKEPIVKIQMVDVTRNKVIDERYLKIKWSDKRVEHPATEVTFERTQVLKPCDTNVVRELTWREVVNQVYAVLGENGISEQVFRQVYWNDFSNTQPDMTVSWDCTNWDSNWASLTSAPKTKNNVDPKPVMVGTANVHGDAVVATWQFEPEEIKTVYCSKQEDTKTFTAKIFLPSKDSRYGDLTLVWKVTFTLPSLPEIVGYYDQYWLPNKVGEEHDILPLQYKSDIQRWWETMASTPKDYCFFDNNLMNPFVYDNTATSSHLIVKNLSSCGSWDMQFAHENQIANHNPNYSITSPYTYHAVLNNGITWDDKFDTGLGYRIYKSAGKWVDTHDYDDFINSTLRWQNFGAYQFWNWTVSPVSPIQKLLQMMWLSNTGDNINPLTLTDHDVDYTRAPWHRSSLIQERRAYLRAEHYINAIDWDNDYYKPILNALDPDPANDVKRADGTYEPARTHTKPLVFNIWGTLNAWNYIPVKTYKAYMIAPLRFNYKTTATWYDGQVNGSPVNWRENFTLTDFRGYLVKDGAYVSSDGTNYSQEQRSWTTQLWKFYEVRPYVLDTEARFAFEIQGNGNVIVNNNLPRSQWITSAELYRRTNGNVDISFEVQGNLIYFWNNTGSRIEKEVKCWIPVRVDYGLGRLESGMEGLVKPHVEPFN